MAGNIFINYRRGDDPGFTQALYSRLELAFPPEQLFMDVDNIAPGLDFVQVLNDQVARCDVLIAVVGQNWLGAIDETGARRLDNPDDFVRLEIESALAQKKRVIPVLVNDAKMPRATDLPEPMKAFARCNAVRLTHERFRADTQGLIKSLEQVLADADAARRAQEEQDRREAKAREEDEARRLKREKSQSARARSLRLDIEEESKRGITPREQGLGIAGRIAALPSEISWYVPFAIVGIFLLGWLLPGTLFSFRFAWGIGSLLYGLAGLVGVGAAIYLRRNVFGGAELALYWYAAISFLAIVILSVVTHFGQAGHINSDAIALAAAAVSMAGLLYLRRQEMGGLEGSIYWLGISMAAFWVFLTPIATSAWAESLAATLSTTYATVIKPYKLTGGLLAALTALSAGLILLWRREKFSPPELAVYLMGIAASLVAVALLV